jgi:hypothetical protein
MKINAPTSLTDLQATLKKERDDFLNVAEEHRRQADNIRAEASHLSARLQGIDEAIAAFGGAATVETKVAAAPAAAVALKKTRAKPNKDKSERKRRDVRGDVLTELQNHPDGATIKMIGKAISVLPQGVEKALEYWGKKGRVDWIGEIGGNGLARYRVNLADYPEQEPGDLPSAPPQTSNGAVDMSLGPIVDALDEAGDEGLDDEGFLQYGIDKEAVLSAVTAGVVQVQNGRYYATPAE